MEDALKHGDWLVANTFSIADVALTPYVNRLAMMNMGGMWENGRLPRVTDCHIAYTVSGSHAACE